MEKWTRGCPCYIGSGPRSIVQARRVCTPALVRPCLARTHALLKNVQEAEWGRVGRVGVNNMSHS